MLEYQVEGKRPVTLEAGDVLFIPAGTSYAVKNVGSGTATELAMHFVEKRKPLVVPPAEPVFAVARRPCRPAWSPTRPTVRSSP